MRLHRQKTGRRRRLTLLAYSALVPMLAPLAAVAGPQGATVVAGSASVSSAGATLTVDQTSARAIVNWRSFSVGAGETARFNQPSSAAAILNRVTGADPSALMGQISANGRVYLINPNGVVVGPEGRIETNGFVASTMNVRDADFLSGGPLRFEGDSKAGVTVLGRITAATGDVVLVAERVENAGRIEATEGTAALIGGRSVVYAPDGAGDIVIETPGGSVENSGAMAAAAVQLRAAGSAYALAVKSSGAISATSVRSVGGRVLLEAGDGEAEVSGAITARDGSNGGDVRITGGAITVASSSRIDASAEGQGAGGDVTLLAGGSTLFEGRILARGGDLGGDGGQVEVSGGHLKFRGVVDAGSTLGRAGHLLLDPATLNIDAVEAANIVASLASTDVTAQADTLLTVDSAIVTSSTRTLTLDAPTIQVNADIDIGGQLQLYSTNAATGTISSVSGATIKASTLYMPGDFTTANFAGALKVGNLTLDTGSHTSLTATNAANEIGTLGSVMVVDFTGDVSVSSSTAMSASGEFNVGGALRLTSSGNLTFNSGAIYTTTGQSTLRATGAFINNAGSGVFPGAGRVVIYSSSSGFNAGGLGYPTYNNVNYPSDPQGGNVVYFAGTQPTLTITANNATRSYGAANPAFSAAYSGGSASDLSTLPSFRVLGAGVNVGTYTIEPYGAASSSHLLSYVNGVLTVTPASLTITANSATRTYGAANPTLSASYSGLVNGDTAAVVSGLSLSTGATATSGVGSYAIVASGASAPNYAISFVNGTLTVTPAPLRITANGVSRVYGDANPALTVSYSGFVNGEGASVVSGLTVTTAATQASNVGDYAIVPAGASAANYAITYVNGALTVTPAALTIRADDKAQTEGAAPPAYTATFTGLKNGDTASVVDLTFSTDPDAGSTVGEHWIDISGSLKGPANYTLTFVDGVLTVTERPATTNTTTTSGGGGGFNPMTWFGPAGPFGPSAIVTTFSMMSLIPGFVAPLTGFFADTNFSACTLGMFMTVGPYGSVTSGMSRGC